MHAQVESQLRLSREAGLVAARCRLALAMGCVARLCAHSVLADCPVDCISICGTHCSRQLVMRVSSSNDGQVPTFSFGAKTAESSPVESPAFSFVAKPAASCLAGSSALPAFSFANNPAALSPATAALPTFRFTPPKHAGESASSSSTGGAAFSFGSPPPGGSALSAAREEADGCATRNRCLASATRDIPLNAG